MKKLYITPTTFILNLSVEGLIAGSLDPLTIHSEGASVNSSDAWTKSGNSSSSYNVWDDDWSN